MNQQKKAGIIGGVMALSYFVFNIYHAVKVSKGFSFTESFLQELIIAIIVLILLIAPAVALTLNRRFKNKYSWIAWLYPAFTTLWLLNAFLSKDVLSGLPLVGFGLPFCITLTLILVFNKQP